MAKGLNRVTLIGALTQNAELKYTAAGLAILDIPLAGIEQTTDSDGEPRDITWYHRATLFGKYAEDMVDQLLQGTIAYVEGRLNHRTWQDKDTGQKRNSLDIHASRVETIPEPTNPDAFIMDQRNQPRLAIGAINQVDLIGNATRDSEYRLLPGKDYGVTRLGIAINDQFQRNGEQQNRTHFVTIEMWRELAAATQSITKGAPVYVSGRLKMDNWTDKDGVKRYVMKVEANRFQEFNRPDNTNTNTQGAAAPAKAASAPAFGSSNLDIDEEFGAEEQLPF